MNQIQMFVFVETFYIFTTACNLLHICTRDRFGIFIDDGNMNYKVPVPVDDEDGVEMFKDRLLYLANGLMDGIVMEADLPNNYDDKKLPILSPPTSRGGGSSRSPSPPRWTPS